MPERYMCPCGSGNVGQWQFDSKGRKLFRTCDVCHIEKMLHGTITCPQCELVSFNRGDIVNRYCGYCHQFHEDMIRWKCN